MLTHIVCWKYKTGITESEGAAHIAMLDGLRASIEDIEELTVGSDVLHLDRSFDTGLVARFADREALERYTVHPEHKKAAAFGRDISEQIVSVDLIQ